MVSFNMSYSVPYLTYQMTPMVTPSVAVVGMAQASGMAGMPMSVGMPMMGGMGMQAGGMGLGLGMPMMSGIGIQPVGGIGMGLGGAAGLDSSALAAALGVGTRPGLSVSATANLEMQMLLRALLARTGGTAVGAAAAGVAGTSQFAADAESDPDVRMQALLTRVAELNTRIANELSSVQEMRRDMQLGLMGIADIQKRLKKLEPPEK